MEECIQLINEIKQNIEINNQNLNDISEFIKGIEHGLREAGITKEFSLEFDEVEVYKNKSTYITWTQLGEKWRLCKHTLILQNGDYYEPPYEELKPLIELPLSERLYAVQFVRDFLRRFNETIVEEEGAEIYSAKSLLQTDEIPF